MKNECKDGSCSFTQEDYNELDYQSKYQISEVLLRIEEIENYMLRKELNELKKTNNPFEYYLRKINIRFDLDSSIRKALIGKTTMKKTTMGNTSKSTDLEELEAGLKQFFQEQVEKERKRQIIEKIISEIKEEQNSD